MKPSVEQEIERILPMMPTTPPGDTLEIVKARGYLNDQRLLYGCEWVYDESEGKKVRKVKVVCTDCGGEEYLDYVEGGCGRYGVTWGFIDPMGDAVQEGNNCICPCCGRGTTAMHRPAKNQSKEINDHIFLSLHKVEGHLALLSWIIRKLVRHDGTVFYKADMYEGIVVIEKTIVRVRGFFQFMYSRSPLDHWEYTKRFDYQLSQFSYDEVLNADFCETDGTECEKSALVPYLKAKWIGALYPAEYLKLWLKHPNAENLITAGFEDILNDCISDATGYFNCYSKKNFDLKRVESSLDLKKTRPIDILGIDREDIPIAKSGGVLRLRFYRDIKKRFDVMLTEEQLSFCKKQVYSNLMELIDCGIDNGHDVKIVRLLNYLKRQADMQVEEYYKTLVNARQMHDYWNMLYKVYGSLPEELLYPKDLRAAHDEIQMRIEEEENAELNEAIVARAQELSRFNWYDEGTMLFIRPAASYGEFIKEGKALSHCVARYANSHSTGGTNIFFIRCVDEPDKPYYTLELKLPQVKAPYVEQNRGFENCARTEEVERFEAAWLEHIKEIIKKEKSNGKRNRKSGNAERIGA